MRSGNFYVDSNKLLISIITSSFCILIAICQMIINRPGSAVIFFAVALLFFLLSLTYGTKISITEQGISSSILGKVKKFISWDNIAEVCVAGTHILNTTNKNNTGTIYILFSEEKLSDEQLFAILLRWPPKNRIYLKYSKERYDLIQFYWSNTIRSYNIGKLIL